MRPKPESAIRSLKVSEWPEGDQLAWEACCRLPEGLRRGGQAAHMKQVTKDDLAQRYGQFLDYVTRTQQGLTQQDPAGFVVSTIIEGYVAELRARVGSVTLYGNIYKLRRTAELLAPGKDFTWLREIEQDLEWDMRPASKADRIVDSDRIVRAGIELMREAEENPRLSKYRRARQYRNGLMIAFLALLPLRLKNFSSLKIGTEVVQVGTSWHVVIPASETKSRRAEERRIPKLLVPFLARYMEVHRLILQPRSNGLWISSTGQALTYSGCERIIPDTTQRKLGIRISPHLFRTCAASMVYLHAGEHPHLASALLQHTDSTITESHYNRARGASFGRAFSALVEGHYRTK